MNIVTVIEGIGVLVVTLLVLVLIHEFGHFFSAKKFGIKVLEFGFGIPPRVWGKKLRETIYSINLLPIGGFVRLFGEDETDKKILDDPTSFAAKPVLQRIIVVCAGVFMNLLLAVAVFWAVLAFSGFQQKVALITPFNFVGARQVNVSYLLINGVSSGSPAGQAGIQGGDTLVKFNGQDVTTTQQVIDLTKQYAGQTVTLTLRDPNNNERIVSLVPRQNPPANEGALGISFGEVDFANLYYDTLDQKLLAGLSTSYNFTAYSLNILSSVVHTSVETKNIQPVSNSVSGPVGIWSILIAIIQNGSLSDYFNLLALLSLNLAIINILPLPALDGGRLAFLLVELVSGKKVKASVESMIHTIGMAILIILIFLVTYSDIRKFF